MISGPYPSTRNIPIHRAMAITPCNTLVRIPICILLACFIQGTAAVCDTVTEVSDASLFLKDTIVADAWSSPPCWKISRNGTVDDDIQVEIDFRRFDVVESSNCTQDYIVLSHGSPNSSDVIVRACGESPGEGILGRPGEVLYVYYHQEPGSTSDGAAFYYSLKSKQKPGTQKWDVITTDDGAGASCASVTHVKDANLFFLDWISAGRIPSDPADRCWKISNNGTISDIIVVEIEFNRFNVEDSKGCVKDYLTISHGGFNSSDVILRACGKSPAGKIQGRAGEVMYVHYHMEPNSTSTGWEFSYTLEWAQSNDNTALIAGATVGTILGVLVIGALICKVCGGDEESENNAV